MLSMIVLGGGAFWTCLGHESGAFINEISAFTKLSLPSATWGYSHETMPVYEEVWSHLTPNFADALILDF